MPFYMDIHQLKDGETAEDIAQAHLMDITVQHKYGVNYEKYWLNEKVGKVFCFAEAPSAEAAIQVHREAHGTMAEKVIEVSPELSEGFLGMGEINAAGAVLLSGTNMRDSGIRTIVFTDIVESTNLTQRLGDDAAMQVVEAHDEIVRRAIAATGGREVKHTGDGIMASFHSAASAVKAAIMIHSDLRIHCEARADCAFKIRIGAAAGEPVERHSDLFGSTVQLASRLCSSAAPEQILVSNAVAELCLGKGMQFQELGEITVKGFDRPVRAQAVVWL
ncbi:MAG: hypothetical protein NVS1B14_05660 [Vulcanimicrobiaceae bacterium]